MSIRTILVDDEPLATQGLQLRLQAHDDVEVVGTAANGREAIRQIKTNKPDLVFLDIQMPELDGFAVLRETAARDGAGALPLVVFLTAFEEFALDAFGVEAVDYLVKPVTEQRFDEAMRRVRRRLTVPRGDAVVDSATGGTAPFRVRTST